MTSSSTSTTTGDNNSRKVPISAETETESLTSNESIGKENNGNSINNTVENGKHGNSSTILKKLVKEQKVKKTYVSIFMPSGIDSLEITISSNLAIKSIDQTSCALYKLIIGDEILNIAGNVPTSPEHALKLIKDYKPQFVMVVNRPRNFEPISKAREASIQLKQRLPGFSYFVVNLKIFANVHLGLGIRTCGEKITVNRRDENSLAALVYCVGDSILDLNGERITEIQVLQKRFIETLLENGECSTVVERPESEIAILNVITNFFIPPRTPDPKMPPDVLCISQKELERINANRSKLIPKSIYRHVEPSKDYAISIPPSKYPQARRDEKIVDDFHGTKVKDPYRWMEDPDLPETKAWVSELNKIAVPFLAQGEDCDKINERLAALADIETYDTPDHRGEYYYHWYNSGLQNQLVYYQSKSYKEKGKVFFDPNLLSADATIGVFLSRWSRDGKIWAYGLCEKGSDWMTLKFKKATGEDLPDTIKHVSYCIGFPNNAGVVFTCYREDLFGAKATEKEKSQKQAFCYHKLGTPQKDDIFFTIAPPSKEKDEKKKKKKRRSSTRANNDGYRFVPSFHGGYATNRIFYYEIDDLKDKDAKIIYLKSLFVKLDASYTIVGRIADSVLVLTNLNASMFKIVMVKIGPESDDPLKWKIVIPEDLKRKLNSATIIDKDKLMVEYLEDCSSKMYIYNIKSRQLLYHVPIGIGTVSDISCDKRCSEVFFNFQSFLFPDTTYRFDLKEIKDGQIQLEEIRRVEVADFDPSQYKVQQVFTKSKDGTKIPMFIVHRVDIKFDGQNVTMLDGYGGLNVPQQPSFSIITVFLLKNLNGVFASANLRGGSEYGEKWHEGGMHFKKQNVFDDFIACAEYLINNKFTSPSKLVIHGGSNGGILIGAVSAQRPDLFGAAINRVGALDMLRLHRQSVGAHTTSEYGNPEKSKEDFECIFKYSPLHNIRMKPGLEWPATLLMTADHDERVVPAHSLKYIAELYYVVQKDAANFQKKPLLCLVEANAGHGHSKPKSKGINETTQMLSFISQVLGATYQD